MVRRIRTEDRISIYAISTIFKNVSVMYNEDTECALLSLYLLYVLYVLIPARFLFNSFSFEQWHKIAL